MSKLAKLTDAELIAAILKGDKGPPSWYDMTIPQRQRLIDLRNEAINRGLDPYKEHTCPLCQGNLLFDDTTNTIYCENVNTPGTHYTQVLI